LGLAERDWAGRQAGSKGLVAAAAAAWRSSPFTSQWV